MRYAYRCMFCRARNMFIRKIDDYIIPRKCKSCKRVVCVACEKKGMKKCPHKKFYWDKSRNKRTDYCNCSGYHYTHRVNSKFCEKNKNVELNIRVERHGEERQDVLMDMAYENPTVMNPNDPCPF